MHRYRGQREKQYHPRVGESISDYLTYWPRIPSPSSLFTWRTHRHTAKPFEPLLNTVTHTLTQSLTSEHGSETSCIACLSKLTSLPTRPSQT